MSDAAPTRAPTRAYALLSLTALIWAGNSVAGKIGAGHIDPVLLTTLRWWIAALIVIAFSWPRLREDWPRIVASWPLLLAYGVSGFCLFNLLLYSALTTTSVVNVMIEQAAIPFFIFAGNFALFRVRATWAQMAGFGLTLTGVIITATHGDIAHLLSLKLNIGDAMMLLAVIIYAGYSVALKWKPAIHWQSFLATTCAGAALACVPFLIWRNATQPIALPDATGWAVTAYAALLVAVVSSATWVAGIDLIGANRAGLFINLLPIFGVILSILILHEPLHSFHVIALSLVCAGIVLAEWSRMRAKPA